MKDPVAIVGIGEMGGVFARGFLRAGHPVYPFTRDMDLAVEANQIPETTLNLVAVGEADLHPVLERVPRPWGDRLGLLQNELLPRDWQRYGLPHPTVISAWFEKKKGQDVNIVLPSPVYGPHAGLIQAALDAVEVPNRRVEDEETMLWELVRKNVYILTTNIAGLEVGGTASELWAEHEPLAREVADEVIAIQRWLTGRDLDSEGLIQGMVEAFEGDPQHKCMGRSAPGRLRRALGHADEAGLDVPRLRVIAERAGA